MYLPVPPQPDCATAWREAVRAVDAQPGHSTYNVIVDVANPTANTIGQAITPLLPLLMETSKKD